MQKFYIILLTMCLIASCSSQNNSGAERKEALELDRLFNLALSYDTGDGVASDIDKAIDIYKQAADQGSVGAEYNLALIYDNGKGVPENNELAVYWYERAANNGLGLAQYNLGIMYDNGEGVAQNKKIAFDWIKLAHENGAEDAGDYLAIMYINGEGTEKNIQKGTELLLGRKIPDHMKVLVLDSE